VLDDGRAGVLFPPGDPAALATAITDLAADRARLHQLADAGARRAVDAFSLERCAQDVVALYRDACADPPAAEGLTSAWTNVLPRRALGL
jgi:phosphatidylinositol alpha-mannosyltransferase